MMGMHETVIVEIMRLIDFDVRAMVMGFVLALLLAMAGAGIVAAAGLARGAHAVGGKMGGGVDHGLVPYQAADE
jgi:hypothetical protein